MDLKKPKFWAEVKASPTDVGTFELELKN